MSNGLLLGLSEGLKSGLSAYQDERTRRDILAERVAARKEANQLRELGLLKEGISKAPAGYIPGGDEKVVEIDGESFVFDPKVKQWNPNPLQSAQLENTLLELEKKKQEQTPIGQYKAGGDAAKKEVGMIADALQSLTGYESELAKGEQPRQGLIRLASKIPAVKELIPDTPLDVQEKSFIELLGRLHSQGQIGKQEMEEFRGMLPKRTDPEGVRKQKVARMRTLMESKLTARGLSPKSLGELGFDLNKMGYGKGDTQKMVTVSDRLIGGSGLSPEKKKRLEELRAKRGK